MKQQGGFSLVELMVAMVIGLIIILGAGQLFLTVFQTNRQVETLSEKQAAVNFAVETMLRDIRRADLNSISWNGSSLTLTVPNRGDVSGCATDVEKIYTLDGDELKLDQGCGSADGNPQAVVSAFDPDGPNGGFHVQADATNGVWVVYFDLIATDRIGDADSLIFYAVNRTAAVKN